MRFSTLINHPILLLGAGKEGRASAQALREHGFEGPLFVTGDTEAALPGAEWLPQDQLFARLPQDTWVIRSPGFAPHHPLRQLIQQSPWQETTASRMALAELAAHAIQVIGITGSKGKSTISALTNALLQASGLQSTLVGNIGVPVLSQLTSILIDRPIVVMELSSYHCDDLGDLPITTAVVGRLFPEHLSWHGDLSHYYRAKLNLLRSSEFRVVDAANHTTLESEAIDLSEFTSGPIEWVNHPAGLHFRKGHFFEGETCLISDSAMKIPGLHNRANACLAFAAARTVGGTLSGWSKALACTAPLPYRLQSEGIIAGIEWINDSISTAPEASAAAIEAFGPGGVDTLIVGGQDRGYNYAPLIDTLKKLGTPTVIGLPDTGRHLFDPSLRVVQARDLEDAVQLALKSTPKGGRCVFSPGAPSYHLWSGFEARGEDFRKFIKAAHG